MDIDARREAWQNPGHGYRVETRIILWQSDDVLKVPVTALFRQGEDWAVFRVSKGTATLQVVEVGRRHGIEAEILEGLSEGDRIVLHPSGRVTDGTRVVQRTTG